MENQAMHWVDAMNVYGQAGTPFLFILDFELHHAIVLPADKIVSTGLKYRFPSMPLSEKPAEPDAPDILLQKSPVSFREYKEGFEKAMQAIQAGDTYLLNLCYTTPVKGIQSLEEVYQRANAPYKLLFPQKFVVFSPEQFISIADGVIRTFPMKGTIDASIPYAAELLLADLKEQEEHATVVDLLRNDLSIVANQVTVERYRYITEIRTSGKNLLQCSSAISGRLAADYHSHLGDIFQALLPAGSVTGAPKKRTVEWIKSIEPEPRGYYTGVFGWFDGLNVDSAVMIRMIEQRADGFFYRSGGGITYQSEARQEYQEMVDKVYIPIG